VRVSGGFLFTRTTTRCSTTTARITTRWRSGFWRSGLGGGGGVTGSAFVAQTLAALLDEAMRVVTLYAMKLPGRLTNELR
jgi:hypothetical protein